ncbi:hypothetical protein, partial [Metabacillus litoralis]|uniref:hypothetical protein n=1 Tax=Metabacillus litoralis TaxID=152268 RepID=UPI001CFD47A0
KVERLLGKVERLSSKVERLVDKVERFEKRIIYNSQAFCFGQQMCGAEMVGCCCIAKSVE